MPTSKQTALEAVHIAEGHKAQDVTVIDLGGRFVADYFVVATILNRHHGRAIAGHLEDAAKARGERVLSVSGVDEGTWVLVDLGDVVVHLFEGEYRKFYDLESLWEDAPEERTKTARKKKTAKAKTKTKAKGKTRRARPAR